MLARGVWRLLQDSPGGYGIRPYVMGWFMAALHSVSVGEHSICSRAVWRLLQDSPGGYRIRPYANQNLARRGQTERDGKALRNACKCLLFLQREAQRLPWRGAVTEGD